MEGTRPIELSKRLIEANNRRDLETMIGLVSDPVEFVRPGPVVLTSKEEVRQQYLRDWGLLDETQVEVRHIYEVGSTVAVELTMHARRGNERRSVEVAVFHEWQGGKLVRYRAYFDVAPP